MDPRARRELGTAVGLCLAGAALVLLAATQPWAVALVDPGPPLPPTRESLPGGAVAPPVPALGLVALAASAALLATRRTGRPVVGAVLLLAGGGVVGLAVSALLDARAALPALAAATGVDGSAVRSLQPTGWPVPAAVGGLGVALAGLLAVARGRRWAAMSARYDVPGEARRDRRPADPDAAAWEALDRGEDPTA